MFAAFFFVSLAIRYTQAPTNTNKTIGPQIRMHLFTNDRDTIEVE